MAALELVALKSTSREKKEREENCLLCTKTASAIWPIWLEKTQSRAAADCGPAGGEEAQPRGRQKGGRRTSERVSE